MTMWVQTHPVARKSHYCDMCNRVIEPGEKYLRGKGFGTDFDGVSSWAECVHCEAFKIICDLVDPYSNEYGPDDFSEFEPDTDQQKEWRWLWGNKWRTASDDLAVVPS